MATEDRADVTIRAADVWDIVEVLKLLYLWTEEASHLIFGRVNAATGVFVANAIKNNLVLLAERENEVIGLLMLREVVQPWDGETRIIVEDCYFVRKEFRNTQAAVLLLKQYKQILDVNKMNGSMGMSNGTDLDRKDKFMLRNGFQRFSSNYYYKGE